VRFEIEPYRKEILLEGLDDIAMMMKRGSAISVFEQEQRARFPWLWTNG
jgi:3-isopropylmalate/(R)-2-methylmalate dehydratase small subunit